jgi:hypothetical protein
VEWPLVIVIMTTPCRAATPNHHVRQAARATPPSTSTTAAATTQQIGCEDQDKQLAGPQQRIQPAPLACLPLPEGAKYTAAKMAVINIADPPEYPEEATSYAHLWASFTCGITVPEMFVRIFDILGCQIAHDYYLNMVLRNSQPAL